MSKVFSKSFHEGVFRFSTKTGAWIDDSARYVSCLLSLVG